MKAAILHAAGDARVVELENPVCGPKDVIIKTVRSGICGSDVTAYTKGNQYMNIDVDGEFGHETAGYITEVGSEADGLAVGMRVFPQPIAILPLGKSNMLGGFSEYIRVPDAKSGENIFILPDTVSYDEGALIEPFAVGTRGENVPGAKQGDHVVVYGVGTIGISCISGLVAQGIKPVAVVRNNKKRAL
jgi:threonine dehydrogenase-like Zn-dependent dehydrogenase